jgi:hypothetical protein
MTELDVGKGKLYTNPVPVPLPGMPVTPAYTVCFNANDDSILGTFGVRHFTHDERLFESFEHKRFYEIPP